MADDDDDQTRNYKIGHNVRKCIVEEAADLEDIFFGLLIGNDAENVCWIISCIKCTNFEKSDIHTQYTKEPDWTKETKMIRSLIPTGLKICGLCYIGKNSKEVELSWVNRMFTGVEIQDKLINGKMLLWLLDIDSSEMDKAYVYNVQERQITATKIELSEIDDDFFSEHISFRLKCKLEICTKELKDSDIFMALSKEVTEISSKLLSSSFYIPECQLLFGNEISCNTSKTCGELLENIIDKQYSFTPEKMNKNRKPCRGNKDVLNVQLMNYCNKESTNHNHVPVMLYQKQELSYINIILMVDLLVMVRSKTSITELPSYFIRGIKDQLQAMIYCIETYSKNSALCVPKVYHFKTHQWSYLTTCVYPWKSINGELIGEKEFENERTSLLTKLLLPPQRPTLHPNNNFLFQDDLSKATRIVNPHEGLTNPGGPGCKVAVVDGSYSYHHYMQDNFDDNKWGCAYRSLQTICSWFLHQGYNDKPVPDHRSIQQALVAIGDKEPSFVGSKKWVGSFEVNLCLDYFLGVTSKIMAVNSGEELQYKGRELIQHFETQGTPIMIGGGVLAHTILGVSFNDKTGEIKFLILDPHYTGEEDLKIILDKGWCGWKNQLFWNQRAHYNLCMPQRPKKV